MNTDHPAHLAQEHKKEDGLTSTFIDTGIRIIALGILLYWSFRLIQPFITLLIWSCVLTVALYPAYEWLSHRLNGRRNLAAFLLTIFILLIVIGPLSWMTLNLVSGVHLISAKLEGADHVIPPPPVSVRSWLLIGERLFEIWDLASRNWHAAAAQLAPNMKPYVASLLGLIASASTGSLTFLASIVVSGFLFSPAPSFVRAIRRLFKRLNTKRGEAFADLATATIRTVAFGIVGISVLQALLTGLGLAVAGVPAPALLSFFVLILGIIQIGSAIVWIPAVIWGWLTMETSHALIFIAYMLPIGLLDNILRPLVMVRGLRTPIPVTLIGVLGGILAYGITGLFLGPIVLAVVWELCSVWIAEERGSD
jgi:predicted PurR-regulated permease PerM